ncbi:hypothetical protein ACIPWI_38320 [Streptomyces sp. NPDC090046]|uniref:hypothetical protein n=1 Tax=Streptomyces sp. NPDC090046 TaxID=3365928 RepID=UPI0037F13BF4
MDEGLLVGREVGGVLLGVHEAVGAGVLEADLDQSSVVAIDRGGVYRHPVRYVRLRLDASVEDVPGFGEGTAAAAG